MKFNKTLVAVAIAGIAAAPSIATAATTLSGVVQIQVKGSDADAVEAVEAADAVVDPATGAVITPAVEAVEGVNPDLTVASADTRFQIVSEHELNSGLTGYGSLQYNLDTLSGDASVGADNVYVGIKGGFGDFRMGEVPVMAEYGQVANDIHDLTDAVNGGLSYTGSFGPVGLGVAFSPEGNEDSIGLGVKFGLGGFSIGAGGEQRGDGTNVSVGASFALAGASVAAHYWMQDDGEDNTDDATAIAVKLGYGFGGVTAGLTVSQLSDGADKDHESKIRLDLAYGLGGDMELSTRININADAPGEDVEDETNYRVMLSKSF